MSSSVEDVGAPPDSWEVADLDATMSRLMLSSKIDDSLPQPPSTSISTPELVDAPASDSATLDVGSEDLVNSVDQFLREALHNPRERVSVLRMEQDIEKFIQDPTQQQMEFHQLPTSYLRLAAHRVAQHYFLQSMVLLDNNLPDSSASRIIVRKTSDARVPSIRLAAIPVNLPTEDNDGTGVVKVAIKQRPHKRSQGMNSSNANSSKNNSLKSVEERKEDYNRARARIFSSTTATFKPENEARVYQNVTVGVQKVEENPGPGGEGGSSDLNGSGGGGRDLIESSSASSSRSSRSRTEKELPVARAKTSNNNNNNNNINTNNNNNNNNNNRVAIFRDREVERKDPDFDRSYDRYAQRFDPGFGFNGGGYTIQPMYAPVVSYNTEFPQLGGHRPLSDQHHHQQHHRLLPQHLPPGGWAGGYGPQETTMGPPYSHHHHVGPPSPLYMHSAQYPCQRPGMPFIHPHEHLHQSYLQSQQQQQQHDAGFGLARPR